MIRAPIETSLLTKKSRSSNIFSNTNTVPRACVAVTIAIEVRSVGKRGPDAALNFRDLVAEVVDDVELLAGWDANVRLPHLELDPELAERRDDRDQVVGLDVLDRHSPPVARRKRGKARDLDVLRADAVRSATEPLDALDAENVRADSVDAGAERDEEVAEVLDVGLAGRVPDDRLALGEHGCHHRVLGRHHS